MSPKPALICDFLQSERQDSNLRPAAPFIPPTTYAAVLAAAAGLPLASTGVPARVALRRHAAEAVAGGE